MEILFVLLPISLLLISIAIAVFIWAVNSDQFDDLDRQGYEILFDKDENDDKDNKDDKDDKDSGGVAG